MLTGTTSPRGGSLIVRPSSPLPLLGVPGVRRPGDPQRTKVGGSDGRRTLYQMVRLRQVADVFALRRAAKVDENHGEIVSALVLAGYSVQSLAVVGDGCPDLLVGGGGWNVLIEVKDGRKDPSKRRFTPAQKSWHRDWRGTAHVAESVDQALAIMGAYRSRGRPTGD